MTIEDEILKAAAYLKTQHPRPVHNGLFIDQLMVAAAGELGGRALKMVEMLNLTPPQGLFALHPDHTSPMTVGPESFLEDPLSEACDRLYDMLLGDDGEAYFQAERFLKQHRPDLYAKIGMQQRSAVDPAKVLVKGFQEELLRGVRELHEATVRNQVIADSEYAETIIGREALDEHQDRVTREVLRDEGGHEIEWAPGDMVSEPRGKSTNIGE